MRGALAIARKDLREVRVALVLFGVVAFLLVWASVEGMQLTRKQVGPLEGLRLLGLVLIPLAAFIITNVVVARELTSKTQVFLESLPVTRAAIFAGKLLVVIVGILLVSGAAFAGGALGIDDPPAGLLPRVALRLLGFDAAVIGPFFLLGLLGRYRVPLGLLAGLTLIVLASNKDLELIRIGPLALFDETFATDAHAWPRAAFLQSLAALVVCVLAAGALVAVREGDVPARLAEKMSAREKSFVVIGLLLYITLWSVLDEKKQKEPYTLGGAVATQGDGVTVFLRLDPDAGADSALADWLHGELVAARRWLTSHEGVTPPVWPPFFLVARADLPEGVFERGRLTDADGILFRVRPTDDPRHRERLVVRMIEAALATTTHKRVALEERRFLLDGFSSLVVRRDRVEESIDHLLLAVESLPRGPTRADLDDWESLRGRVGDEAARATATVGLRVLVRSAGRDKAVAFLAETLGFDVPQDARALWRTPDIDDALSRHCGIDRASWLALWQQEHAAGAARFGAELDARPRFSAAISFEPMSAGTRRATVTLDVAGGATPAEATPVHFEWSPVGLDVSLPDDDDVRNEERPLSSWRTGAQLDRTFSKGERFLWRVAQLRAGEAPVVTAWRLAEAE